MNEIKLIALYCYICQCYDTHLRWVCQRFSPNSTEPLFSDSELLTVYLFSVMEEEKYKIKSIHTYATKYLLSWFPCLPSYQAFNRRLNQLAAVFPFLIELLLQQVKEEDLEWDTSLLDSLPIMTCRGKRAGKVAPELTAKGYCATKQHHYFGVKLHAIAFWRPGTLPLPEYLVITPANEHDLTAIRPILERLAHRSLVGDKAYADQTLHQHLARNQDAILLTPVKLVKGQTLQQRQRDHAANRWFSRAVSRIRQPIESFFNWLLDKNDIQRAAKVRSHNGLLVHVFGKIAAAIALWVDIVNP